MTPRPALLLATVTVSRIRPDGTKDSPLASGLPGIHAVVFAPPGPFGGDAHAASWESGKIVRITPGGRGQRSGHRPRAHQRRRQHPGLLARRQRAVVADRQRSRIVGIEAE